MFGNRCLLILDGLDEHVLGYNDDVMKIIRGQKFPRCHVLVTSRPHSTRHLESHFNHIVRVNGFSSKEAEKFAYKILKDSVLVAQVLAYNPGNFKEEITLHNCPILLSFMCLLVREDQIDLSNEKIDTGEIYTRMVRCLYKKFVIRQNLEYQHDAFTRVLTAVGKIAYQTLLTGKALLRRSEVLREVGLDAFDYGLLIGHEDAHKLIRDETADIFVTFPHRSLQEFLGAFYFVQALDKGESLDSLQGDNAEPLFMTNPLFFFFCMWFVQHSASYFVFKNIENVRQKVQNYILKKINTTYLDFPVIATRFPAIDIEKAVKNNDTAGLAIYSDILSKCQNVRALKLENSDSLDWVLTSMRHVLPLVNYFAVTHFVINRIHSVLIISRAPSFESPMNTDAIQSLHRHFPTDLSLYISGFADATNDSLALLSEINNKTIKMVCVDSLQNTFYLRGRDVALPHFTNLHYLSFKNTTFDESEIFRLSQAQRTGNFPNLIDLNFTHCYGLRSHFSKLFSSPCPTTSSFRST